MANMLLHLAVYY